MTGHSWPRVPKVVRGIAVFLGFAAGSAGILGTVSAAPGVPAVPAGAITSVAGGVGGPGLATDIDIFETGSLAYVGGSLYIGDSGSVREVSARTDVMTTPVGPVASDTSRDGGLATSFAVSAGGIMVDRVGNLLISTPGWLRVAARRTGAFYGRAMVKGHIYAVAKLPHGANAVAVDPQGNFVLTDRLGNKILVLAMRSGVFYGRAMAAGRTYTVAGTGAAGRTGDGGPALRARLNWPEGLAVDHHGNLVIADTYNSRIRVVAVKTGQFYGQHMRKGDIYTIVYRTGAWYNGGFAGDGGPALRAKISRPDNVTIDSSGNLLISDFGNSRIRLVAARSGTYHGRAVRFGYIYTVAGGGRAGYGGPARRASIWAGPVIVDGFGNLVISGLDQVLVVAASDGTFYGQPMKRGYIYPVAGHKAQVSRTIEDGWLAPRVQLDAQSGISVDSDGNVIMADSDYEYSEVSVIAGQTGTFYGRAMVRGHWYAIAGNGSQLGDGRPAIAANLMPYDATADHLGNLIVTDVLNNRIRVIANSSGTFYGQPMTAGDIYTIAGGGSGNPGSGDGGPATQAVFSSPEQVTVDSTGNIVVADTGDYRIRVVAASTGLYYGQPMTAGDIYTIAGTGVYGSSPDGTVATSAQLSYWTRGVAIDGSGNIVIAELGDELIQVVATQSGQYYGRTMLAGHIYTIVGGGTAGLGDGGPAVKAKLDIGEGILVDLHGNIVIPGGDRVRLVAASSGTFYGVPMTKGDIYTVAGTDVAGFSGDGGPAVKAVLEDPQSVAVDAAGDLVVGDGRIRQITQ